VGARSSYLRALRALRGKPPSAERMSPRWCFIVRVWDRPTGLVSEERFLWERSARERATDLRRAGYWAVAVKPQRVKVNQPRNSGYDLGRATEDQFVTRRTFFLHNEGAHAHH